MRFVWNAIKSRANLAKHGLSFETARKVFDDPLHLSVLERIEDGEERWQTLGMVGPVLLLVAHTWATDADGDVIRIISARKATRNERRAYEQTD